MTPGELLLFYGKAIRIGILIFYAKNNSKASINLFTSSAEFVLGSGASHKNKLKVAYFNWRTFAKLPKSVQNFF